MQCRSSNLCTFSFFVFQCNNPLTKEPKLTAAVRIAPEWVDYDNEIKTLLERISNPTDEESEEGEEELEEIPGIKDV